MALEMYCFLSGIIWPIHTLMKMQLRGPTPPPPLLDMCIVQYSHCYLTNEDTSELSGTLPHLVWQRLSLYKPPQVVKLALSTWLEQKELFNAKFIWEVKATLPPSLARALLVSATSHCAVHNFNLTWLWSKFIWEVIAPHLLVSPSLVWAPSCSIVVSCPTRLSSQEQGNIA